jgi:signal transduction histidine kinase/HPt (histidine-containing phosphotransfer) domain-containing protein/ActR/RegA family two-component response regulator
LKVESAEPAPPGIDPDFRGADFERFAGATALSATAAFVYSMVAGSLAPALAVLAIAAAISNALVRVRPTQIRARAHMAIALLCASALALPAADADARPLAILWLFVAAVASRPLTSRAGGVTWATVTACLAAATLARSAVDPLSTRSLVATFLTLLGIALGYSFVEFFLSTREKHSAGLRDAVARALHAEAGAHKARAANEDLLARVTHDLHTPLEGLLGVSELLRREPLPRATAERLDLIRGSAGAMLYVVRDLLDRDSAQRRGIELQSVRVDFRRALAECIDLATPLASERGSRFELSFPETWPDRLLGDPVRLRQVLMNLLGHALRSARHGVIRVSVRELARERELSVVRFALTYAVPPDAVSPVTLPPAASASPAESNPGLAICHTLVEAMGGKCGVEADGGAETTLWFELRFREDLSPTPPSWPALNAQQLAALAERPAGALLVEEDPVLARAIREMLEGLEIPVDAVATPAEALAAYLPRKHALALIDLGLSPRSGIELALDLRFRSAIGTGLVILGMGADARFDAETASVERVFDLVLQQPIRLQDVHAAIADHFSLAAPAGAAGERPAGGLGAIDPERLATLRALERQIDASLIRELVESFAESSALLAGELRTALGRSDRESVRRLAHKLRGTCGNIGAQRAMTSAAALEATTLDADPREISAQIEALALELEGATTELRRWVELESPERRDSPSR